MTETDLAMQFPGSTVTVRATIGGVIISHILETGTENHIEVTTAKLTANSRNAVALACNKLARMARGHMANGHSAQKQH